MPHVKPMSEEARERRKAARELRLQERSARNAQRAKIVKAANEHRSSKGVYSARFKMKHLQTCVNVCRQNKLVKNTVLVEAGFNPRID